MSLPSFDDDIVPSELPRAIGDIEDLAVGGMVGSSFFSEPESIPSDERKDAGTRLKILSVTRERIAYPQFLAGQPQVVIIFTVRC